MKKLPTLALTALTLFSVLATIASTDAEARRRHHGRNVALGVLGTAAAVAIIAGSSRSAYADDDYRYRRGPSRCDRLAYRCNNGSDWACDKYERTCY